MSRKLALCHPANAGAPNPSLLFVNYRPSDWVVQPTYFLGEETEPHRVSDLSVCVST